MLYLKEVRTPVLKKSSPCFKSNALSVILSTPVSSHQRKLLFFIHNIVNNLNIRTDTFMTLIP